MESSLQQLIDKQAISDILQRYSRTLDWLDEDAQAKCYWPDAAVDYGFFTGNAEDFLPIVMEVERASDRRWHMLSSPLIAFHSPTSASSECYGIAAASKIQEDGSLAGNLFGGRYLDKWEKRSVEDSAEWRISARTYMLDWRSALPDQPGFEPDPEFPLPTAKIDASGHPLYRPL